MKIRVKASSEKLSCIEFVNDSYKVVQEIKGAESNDAELRVHDVAERERIIGVFGEVFTSNFFDQKLKSFGFILATK